MPAARPAPTGQAGPCWRPMGLSRNGNRCKLFPDVRPVSARLGAPRNACIDVLRPAVMRRWRARGVFYGWWVLAAAVVVNALGGGIHFYGFAIFFIPLREDLGISAATASLIFALARAEGALEGPLAGYLIDRLGARTMMFVAVTLAGVGYMLLPLTNSFLGFFLIY